MIGNELILSDPMTYAVCQKYKRAKNDNKIIISLSWLMLNINGNIYCNSLSMYMYMYPCKYIYLNLLLVLYFFGYQRSKLEIVHATSSTAPPLRLTASSVLTAEHQLASPYL